MTDRITTGRAARGSGTGLVRIEIGFLARHVLGQGEDGHPAGDGHLDHFFQRVRRVAAEFAGMAVVGERHVFLKNKPGEV